MGSVYGPMWVTGGWGLKAATDYSDTLTPDATAELAFDGDLGPAAVNKDGGFYRTTFSGFGMERFPGLTQSPEMQGTLQTFLDWCDALPALDGDSDGVLNGDDCVAGDPDVWGVPEPVTDLTLGRGEYGFFWSQPVGGSGAEYDVLSSYDYSDWYNASCVAAGTSGLQAWNDYAEPPPGEIIFYQVRARNECGLSTLGNNFDGSVRYGTACE